MRIRIALAVLALAAAGCNEPCKGENVDVRQETVPLSCTLQASSPVNITFDVCVKCDQATPTCQVDAQGGGFLLDPTAEVCDSNSSCPLSSCEIPGQGDRRTVTCTITTPASGPVNVMVYDSSQPNTPIPISVTIGGTGTSCGPA